MRFFLIDRITEWKPGERATAIKNISLSEDFFDDHFPRMPVMPGVLILEGMAQIAGLLLEETARRDYGIEEKAIMSVIDKTKFREVTRPGDQLVYEAVLMNYSDLGGKLTVQAMKDGRQVVSTTFTFIFKKIDDDYLKRDRDRLFSLWLRGVKDE